MERHYRRGGLVGPVILIGLGVVFLLNNLGLLGWGVWSLILQLWPVLLIAVGLDILVGRRSIWGSLLVVVVMLAVLAGAIGLYQSRPAGGELLTSETIQRALQGATSGEVDIHFGVGRLEIGSLGESPDLVEGRLGLYRGEQVVEDFHVTGSTAYYTLRSEGVENFIFPGDWDRRGTWSLNLNPGVPLNLGVETGVGEATLDLSGLTISELNASFGVGRVTVTFPAQGRMQARLDGGVGETVLLIPRGMAARIQVDGGLRSVSVPEGYVHQGDTYFAGDFDTAESRVDVVVGGGIGAVSVREIPGS
jgi:hypothetical protein